MASTSKNDEKAADFTEAVITLQESVHSFQKDIENGRQDFVLTSVEPALENDAFPTVMGLTSGDQDTHLQLKELDEHLGSLEKQLRSRGQWHPPPGPLNTPIPTMLDMSDLSNAVTLLTSIITSTHPARQLTPHPSFSNYSWKWDPVWKEFYTYLPARQTYIYLSRWKLNQTRNVWEHVSTAWVTTPDIAVELLGAWEDWTWDPVWGEWCLEVQGEEGDDGRCCVFASRWQVQEDWEWVYVGRMGEAWS